MIKFTILHGRKGNTVGHYIMNCIINLPVALKKLEKTKQVGTTQKKLTTKVKEDDTTPNKQNTAY